MILSTRSASIFYCITHILLHRVYTHKMCFILSICLFSLFSDYQTVYIIHVVSSAMDNIDSFSFVCVYHIEKSPQQQLNMIAMCDVYLLYPSLVKEKLSSWLDVTFIYFSSPVLIYISSQRKKEKICFLFFFLPFSPLHTHQK